MRELISVIIPVYNVEKYLKKCIDSVINQTYKELEIILVDDGSKDKSGLICDEYSKKDFRIKVIHKKNGGLSDARNCGIEASSGKYIAFVDSDDFIDLKMYEKLYKILSLNNADISMCKPYEFRNYDEIVELPNDVEENVEVFDRKHFFSEMYKDYLASVVAWNKLYKREIFDNIRYPKGKIIEDAFVIHYIVNKCNRIAITNQELYFYMQREDSIMHNIKYNLLDELDAIYDRIRYFEEKGYERENFYYNTLDIYRARFHYITRNISKKLGFSIKKFKPYFKQFSCVLMRYPHKIILLKIGNLPKRIIKSCCAKLSLLKLKLSFKCYLRSQSCQKEKYIIFNAPNHGNLGDHAILYAEATLLREKGKKFFCVMHDQTDYFLMKLSKYLNENDVILITGGGNLGSLWEHEQININNVLNKFKNNKIIIFPQTVYYGKNRRELYRLREDKAIYSKCQNLLISCRDDKSYEFCKNVLKVNSILVTDIVCFLNFSKNTCKRKGILVCYRNDKEKINQNEIKQKILENVKVKYPKEKIEYVDTVIPGIFSYEKGRKTFLHFIKKVKKSKLFITDRLHGMLFAAITGTPCIAINNKTGKVKGVFDTMSSKNKYIKYIADIRSVEDCIESLNIEKEYRFDNSSLREKLLNII